MISRCSSPMPEMSVCPVSSSVLTRNVGSSSDRRWSPAPSLSWSPFVLGSMATAMTGSGNVIGSSTIGAVSIGERVAGRRLLEADGGGDLARADLLALLAVVRVHLQEAADALGLAVRRVDDAVAGLDLAGVDAEVGQLADVRVGHDLERERRERLVERGAARELVLGARVDAVHGRHVERARQVVDDRVEQRLHALVLERGAASTGVTAIVERGGAERAPQHLGRHGFSSSRYVSISSSSWSATASISWWWYSSACSRSSSGISSTANSVPSVVRRRRSPSSRSGR